MRHAKLGLGALAVVMMMTGCSRAITFSSSNNGKVKTVDHLEVWTSASQLPVGTEHAFQATAVYNDGSTSDVSDSVTWSSSIPAVAVPVQIPVNKRHWVKAVTVGTCMINATLGDKTGVAPVLVTSSTLLVMTLFPVDPVVPKGMTQAFSATGIFSDGTSLDISSLVNWSSSATSKANVVATGLNGGRVTAVATGSSRITASLGTVSAYTNVLVSAAVLSSIAITPAPIALTKGNALQLTATGTFSDGTTQDLTSAANWSSNSPTIAAIGNSGASKGMLTGAGVGTASVTASYSGVSIQSSVLITSASLSSVQITPSTATFPKGLTQQFIATGTYSDGSTQDITSSVLWSSNDSTVANISNAVGSKGQASALGQGNASITASLGGISVNADVTVSAATLLSIGVTPIGQSVAKGLTQQMTAVGVYSDNTTQDLTASVTWTSTASSVASVSNTSGSKGLLTSTAVGSTTVHAVLGSVDGQANLNVSSATLVSVGVTAAQASIAKGLTLQYTATGVYTDGSTLDLTSSAAWSSSDSSIASVSNAVGSKALATGVSTGTANITAAFASKSGLLALTVSSAQLVSLQVNPLTPSIAKGLTQQFSVTGIYTDSSSADLTSSVTWASSDTSVGTISNAAGSKGRLSALNSGSLNVSAGLSGITAQTSVTVNSASLVSIGITPANLSVAKGVSEVLSATGIYTDGSTQDLTGSVTWSSTDLSVATVSNSAGSRGLVSSLSQGSVTVRGTLSGVYGETSLTVSAATLVSVNITSSHTSLPKGQSTQFTATGTYTDGSTADLTSSIAWTSSNAAVATVSNAGGSKGMLSAVGTGSVTVTATSGSVTRNFSFSVSAAELVSIGVTPAMPYVSVGLNQNMVATGVYTDATTADLTSTVTWSSSDSSIASVSNAAGTRGSLTGVAQGAVTLVATLGSVTGWTNVTVSSAVLSSIQVTPASPSFALGLTQSLVATGTYSDGSTQDLSTAVTWTSSAPSVASVSNASGSKGLVSSASVGSATIGASLGSISSSASLSITSATLVSIGVTPSTQSVSKGLGLQFTATGVYTDASTQDLTGSVTWASSATANATLSNAAGSKGYASTLHVGSTTVSATLSGVTGSTSFSVTSATLVSVQITAAQNTRPAGLTSQFTATGTYTDGSTADLTSSVSFTSSVPAVASVSNAAGSNGLVSAVGVGTTQITATIGTVTSQMTFTATSAALVSIGVSPAAASVAKGLTRQFSATGVYTDSTTSDLTSSVTWSSNDTSVATVSNVAGSKGLVSSSGVGSVTVSATASGITGSTSFSVTSATLVSVSVTPATQNVAKGLGAQYTATGIYTDTTTQDITSSVTWSSSATSVATISNAAGTKGYASALTVGSSTLTATLSGVSGSASIAVTAASLVTVQVTGTQTTRSLGLTSQLTATGIYTDGTSSDISSLVTWASSSTSIATVSNAAGSKGLVSTVGAGAVTLSGSLSGVSGNMSFTVTSAALVSLEVSPATPSVAKGLTKQFSATGVYTDNTTSDVTASVTWSSSSTAVATVSNAAGSKGLASSAAVGTSTIAATLSGITGQTVFTVTSATLNGITVTSASASIAKGVSLSMVATGSYTDGTTSDLTSSVTWSSSNTAVATISNAAGSRGNLSGVAMGSTNASATFGGYSNSKAITVSAAALVSIAVTPVSTSAAKGLSQQFVATGTYTDGSTQVLTQTVTWTASDTSVVSMSNVAGSKGAGTGLAVGTANVIATQGGISGFTAFSVTSATLVSIEITPNISSLVIGVNVQLTATGTYTDGSTQNLTTAVTWASTNLLCASVSNAAGFQGKAGVLALGSTTISAVLNGVTGSATISGLLH